MPAKKRAFCGIASGLTRFGMGMVLPAPEKGEGADEQGAEENGVHFAARDFDPPLYFRGVRLAELLDGSRANQDGPGAGQPDPKLAEGQRVGIFPTGGEMCLGFVQVTMKYREKPGLVDR